jgi:phosphoribosyl 1,2-cyclic phosphodiesterase
MAMEYVFFSRGTARDPDANRLARRLGVENLGEDPLRQRLKRFRLPEEARHVNEDIFA